MELHKPVYQRLNLGLITFSAALMAVMSANLELLRPWALVIGSAECSAAATIPAWFYALTSGHYLQPADLLKASLLHSNLLCSRRVSGAYSNLVIMIRDVAVAIILGVSFGTFYMPVPASWDIF